KFLEALGCSLVALNEEPSGTFAHPPAPSAANMAPLAEEVRRSGADLGAAINVDGDRLGFATGAGLALSEEYGLPLAAMARLRRRPGPMVTNYSTSGMVDAVAQAAGQRVVRTVVGENHVVDRGVAVGAVLAGEGNGGVAVLPTSTTFDGLLTLGVVLEALRVRYAELNPDGSDGVRVTWPDAWLHVRASNTEPLLRIIAEATTPA